jgi:hypothetical protein
MPPELLRDLTSKIEELTRAVGSLDEQYRQSETRSSKKEKRNRGKTRKETGRTESGFVERLLPENLSRFYRKEKERSKPAAIFGAIGIGLSATSKALFRLETALFSTQRVLKTTLGSTSSAFLGSIVSSFKSAFGGIRITRGENIQARSAFSDQFGKILSNDAAVAFAREAKKYGIDPIVRAAASRSFLDTGSRKNAVMVERRFIKTFQESGLRASSALEFAARSANLIAIAGTKYANELARAAANAQIIGVELKTTEDFADSIVGDFEGALERMSELRALGFEIDVNQMMRSAAVGDPESFRKEISTQLSKNANLLDDLQTNRFLRLAIEKDLGMSISDVKRLAGVEQPGYETQIEKDADKTGITGSISKLSVVVAGIATIVVLLTGALRTFVSTIAKSSSNILTGMAKVSPAASHLSTTMKTAASTVNRLGAVTRTTSPAVSKLSTATSSATVALRTFARTLSTHPGAIPYASAGLYSSRTANTIPKGKSAKAPVVAPRGKMGMGGAAASLGIGLAAMGGMMAVDHMGIENQFLYNALQMGLFGASMGALFGVKGALVGGLAGAGIGLGMAGLSKLKMGSGMAAGGLVQGPGSSTGDNILTPLSNGEYVINARATNSYGTDFLDSINSRSYGEMSDRQVNVNDKFETLSNSIIEINSKLPNMIADAMRGIKIEMDGNSVGRIVSNSFTPIERYSAL